MPISRTGRKYIETEEGRVYLPQKTIMDWLFNAKLGRLAGASAAALLVGAFAAAVSHISRAVITQPGEAEYLAQPVPTADGCKFLHTSYNIASGQTKSLAANAPDVTVDLSTSPDGSQTCVWKSPTFAATYTLKPPQLARK